LKKESNKYTEVQECLVQLELFCTNRLLNTSIDQKYGEINPLRQKVLREQYFLEVLRDILKNSFTGFEYDKVQIILKNLSLFPSIWNQLVRLRKMRKLKAQLLLVSKML